MTSGVSDGEQEHFTMVKSRKITSGRRYRAWHVPKHQLLMHGWRAASTQESYRLEVVFIHLHSVEETGQGKGLACPENPAVPSGYRTYHGAGRALLARCSGWKEEGLWASDQA